MKCKEIVDRLRTRFKASDLPVAYHHFNKPPKIPFVVYLVADAQRRGADAFNLLEERAYRIELYTDCKNEDLENSIAELFDDHELSIDEVYIEDQQLYMVSFEFDETFKLNAGGK